MWMKTAETPGMLYNNDCLGKSISLVLGRSVFRPYGTSLDASVLV